VRFVGRVPNEQLPTWYAASDVVLLPSAQDSWGIAVVEGLAAGRVVVTSEFTGASAAIHSGVDGFVLGGARRSRRRAALGRGAAAGDHGARCRGGAAVRRSRTPGALARRPRARVRPPPGAGREADAEGCHDVEKSRLAARPPQNAGASRCATATRLCERPPDPYGSRQGRSRGSGLRPPPPPRSSVELSRRPALTVTPDRVALVLLRLAIAAADVNPGAASESRLDDLRSRLGRRLA
jgi:hypothetical protein